MKLNWKPFVLTLGVLLVLFPFVYLVLLSLASDWRFPDIMPAYIGFKNWRNLHSENKNLFFNLGPENKWEKKLDKKIKKDIEINFNEVMKNLKYL